MDKKKAEKLYRECYRRMTSVARSIVGDDEESRDVVNDVFERLLSPDVAIAEGDEQRYLAASVRNASLNAVKRKNIRERYAQMLFATEQTVVNDDSRWKDAADELADFVARNFKPRMQQVFNLRFVGGMKYEEIAAELGVSRMTVYNDIFGGIDMIKERFRR